MITNYNSLKKDIALNYKRWVALEINLKFIKIVTKIMIYYYLLDFVRSYTAATGWWLTGHLLRKLSTHVEIVWATYKLYDFFNDKVTINIPFLNGLFFYCNLILRKFSLLIKNFQWKYNIKSINYGMRICKSLSRYRIELPIFCS